MATTARVRSRIDAGLREIAAEVEFLPELAQGWNNELEVSRDVWYLEWRELMGRLEGLDRECHAGSMTPDQQSRYRDLLRKLTERLPILRRLGLPLPTVPLDA